MDTLLRGHYEPYISELVIEELATTPDQARRDKLLGYVRQIEPTILAFDEECEMLVGKYMNSVFADCRTRGIYQDCGHAAVATVNLIRHVVSYNFKHLVKDNRIDGFNAVNLQNGYDHMLDIATPERFIVEEGEL